MARRLTALVGVAAAGLLATAVLAGPAAACAGLVTPGGNVRLLRTGTLAAYHAGVEHYITSFRFEGGGAEFGSIVPLPAIPSNIERGGDWTLQRLDRAAARNPLRHRAGRRLDATAPRPRGEPSASTPTAARERRSAGSGSGTRRGGKEDRRPRHHHPQGRRKVGG